MCSQEPPWTGPQSRAPTPWAVSFPLTELRAISPIGPAWPLPPSDSLHWVPLALWWKWPPHSSHPICLADYFQLGLQRPNAAITPQPQWLLLKITFGSKKTSVWWAGFHTKQLKSGCGHGGRGGGRSGTMVQLREESGRRGRKRK